MKAARVVQFSPPRLITIDNMPRPAPGPGQLLVRVIAARGGPWGVLLRAGKSARLQLLPMIVRCDLAGIVEAIGPEVAGFTRGEDVYRASNGQFTGAYAEVSAWVAIGHRHQKLTSCAVTPR